MSQAWMKFYPADWRADPRLRMCSLAARGLWADMLSYMHEGQPYGYLTIDGVAPPVADLAALVARPASEVRKALAELETKNVFSRTGDGVIFSRRMVRDKAKADRDRQNGKGGGNPKLKGEDNAGVNPRDKAQILEARIQNPESNSEATASAPDIRADLFGRGLKSLAKITGKTPDSCRSLVGKWLKSVNDEAIHVLGAIEDAERNRVADPVAWINRSLQSHGANGHGKRTVQDAATDLLERVRSLDEPVPSDLRHGEGEGSVRRLPAR